MSLRGEIFIDFEVAKVCGIREDKKTRRTIILVKNKEGDEIELSITTEQLRGLMAYMTVKRFEAFVAKIKNTRSLSRRTA